MSNDCNYLGLTDDKTTKMLNPSAYNLCYKTKPPVSPNFVQQREFCMTENHVDCSLYKSERIGRMPKEIKGTQLPKQLSPGLIWGLAGLVVVVMAVAAVLLIKSPLFGVVPTETPTPTYTLTSTAQPTATLTPTPIPTPTVVPATPTNTREPIAPHYLETPFGGEVHFIIMRARPGDSLERLAAQYGTSKEAIRAVNYGLEQVLFIEKVLIIPLDTKDVEGVPVFEAYEIAGYRVSVDEIAAQEGVDKDALSRWNDLPADYLFVSSEWVLLPRE